MNCKQRSKSFNFDFNQNNSFPSPAVNVTRSEHFFSKPDFRQSVFGVDFFTGDRVFICHT